jgi:CDP-4-dehydro-6-deoxyglucose reductase
VAGLDWDQYRYRVTGADMVTPVIRALHLRPVDTPLPYRAGQYALLGDTDFRVPQRSYSVANAPRPDGGIMLLVTAVDGGETSTWAHRLRIGDNVLLEGPFGTFVTEPDRTGPALLLGAGSGLAPVRALAEAMTGAPVGAPAGLSAEAFVRRPVVLWHSARTGADTIERDVFEGWQRVVGPGFRFVLTLTRDPSARHHRRIPASLGEEFAELHGWEVFAAGPSGFVTGCSAAARALGAAARDVHTEEFFVDPRPWTGLPDERSKV